MHSASIEFKAGTVIELSLATVIEGKEQQLFGEYFPQVMPIVSELEGKPLGSFSIEGAVSKFGQPKMGALFQWPNMDGFRKLHNDERFLAIKHIRDETLEFFTNAHFFNVEKDSQVTFEQGQSYALIANWSDPSLTKHSDNKSLVTFTPMQNPSNDIFNPTQLYLAKWDENVEQLFKATNTSESNSIEIFKFVLNIPV